MDRIGVLDGVDYHQLYVGLQRDAVDLHYRDQKVLFGRGRIEAVERRQAKAGPAQGASGPALSTDRPRITAPAGR